MTKAGMRGTMVHSLADVLKQLGVSAFNRRGRLPLYGPQSIVCFPPWTEKVVFSEGPYPLSCGGCFPLSQQSPSAEWSLWLTWSICLCVDGEGGASCEERKQPIESQSKGENTHSISQGSIW